MQIHLNSDDVGFYHRAFPQTLPPRRLHQYPLVMASILQKNQEKFQINCYSEQRNYVKRPMKSLKYSKHRPQRQMMSNCDLVLNSTKMNLLDHSNYSTKTRPASVWVNSSFESKPRTPITQSIKAQLYFSPEIRDARNHRGFDMPKLMAQKISTKK